MRGKGKEIRRTILILCIHSSEFASSLEKFQTIFVDEIFCSLTLFHVKADLENLEFCLFRELLESSLGSSLALFERNLIKFHSKFRLNPLILTSNRQRNKRPKASTKGIKVFIRQILLDCAERYIMTESIRWSISKLKDALTIFLHPLTFFRKQLKSTRKTKYLRTFELHRWRFAAGVVRRKGGGKWKRQSK